MNFVQLKNRVDFYLDMTRAPRFTFAEYNIAVNDTIEKFVSETIGDPNHSTPYSVQWVQQVRDDLYTLVKNATGPTITNQTAITAQYYTAGLCTFPNPADYYAFLALTGIIASKTIPAFPTNYNEETVLINDSFKHPTDTKIYYNENSSGFRVLKGTATLSSVNLTYIKTPATYSCGAETLLIDGGPAVTLTNLATYYATEISVYNGTTYQIGATITGVTAQLLTSGQVIATASGTNCDLPDRTHEEIAKRAAATMLLTTANYPAAQAVNSIEPNP
jgi:hypothetical protein